MKPLTHIVRILEAEGWSLRYTGGGHLQARHPNATGLLHFPSTPSDHRNTRNTLAQARRLLKGKT